MTKKPHGLFFEKGARANQGHFFRDLPGRDNGSFHEKSAQIPSGGGMTVGPRTGPMAGGGGGSMFGAGEGDSEDKPAAELKINASPSGGEEAGGGMYGTGKPSPKKDAARLMELLSSAGPGKTTRAKVAAAAPSDWEADTSLPTGFHRPAVKQPEALEAGGDRFFSTDAKSAPHGGGADTRHGLVEGGSFRTRATSSPQMGKHASASSSPQRFLGTSFAKTAYSLEEAKETAGERASDFKRSLGTFVEGAARKGGEAVKSISQSPTGAAVAALLGARLGWGALKGGGRGIARAFGHRPKPAPGLAGQALGGLRKLITGR